MPGDEKDPKELMKQREDVLAKLKKLEEKKSVTKEKIYLKVKGDYDTRLAELNEALKEQEGVVKERISSLKKEASTLRDERETYADKAEELKLRFELGEFEEDEYRRILREEEERIKGIDEKLSSVKGELDSMKEFVSGEEEEGTVEETFTESVGEEKAEETFPQESEEELMGEKNEPFVQEKKFEAAFSDTGANTEEVEKAEIAESLEDSIDDLLKETPDEKPDNKEEIEETVEEPEVTEDAETTESMEDTETAEPEESVEETETSDEEPKIEQAFDTGIISEGDAIKKETSKLEGFPEEPGQGEGGASAEDTEEGLQCPKCKFVNSKDSWYCEKCGAELLQ
jgi:hypothetical protein